jgi:hypothetical protein
MVTTATQLAELLVLTAERMRKDDVVINGQQMFYVGTADDPDSFDKDGGKVGPLGFYEVQDANGGITYRPCLDRIAQTARDGTAAQEVINQTRVPNAKSFFAATRRYAIGSRVAADTGEVWDVVDPASADFLHPLTGDGLQVARLASGMYPVTAWPVVGDGQRYLVSARWTLVQAQRIAPWLLDSGRSVDWICAQTAIIALSRRGGGTLDFTGLHLRLVDYESLVPYPGVSLYGYGCKVTSDWNPFKLFAGVYRLPNYATNARFNWSPIANLTARTITLASASDAQKFRAGGIYNLSNGPGGIKANNDEPLLCQMVRIKAVVGAVLTVDQAIADVGKWVSPQLGQTIFKQDSTGVADTLYNLPDCEVWADSFMKGFEVFPAKTSTYYHTMFTGAGTYNCIIQDNVSHGGAIVYGNAFCYSRFINNTIFVKPGSGSPWLGELKIGSIGTTEIGTRYMEEGDLTGMIVTLVNPGEGCRDCYHSGLTFDLPSCGVRAWYSSSSFRCSLSGVRGRCLGVAGAAMITFNETELANLAPVRAHNVSDVVVTLLGGAQSIVTDYKGNAAADNGDSISNVTINATGGATVDRAFTTANATALSLTNYTCPGRVAINSPAMTKVALRNVAVDKIETNYTNGLRIKGGVFAAGPEANGKSPQFGSRKAYQEITGSTATDVVTLVLPYDLPVGTEAGWNESAEFVANGSGPLAANGTLTIALKANGAVLGSASITNGANAATCNWSAKATVQRITPASARLTITITSNLGSVTAGPSVSWPRPNDIAGRTLALTVTPSAPGAGSTMAVSGAEAKYLHSSFENCANQ